MRDYKNVKVPRKYRTHRTDQETTVMRRRPSGRTTRTVVRTQVPKSGSVFLKAAFLALAAGACLLGWRTYQWTERTGIFQIAGVDVKGVRQLSDADVNRIAGVFSGQNIFRADIRGAAERARAHPWVKDVSIFRKLPNRISMVIEERVPAVIVEMPGGRFLADQDGIVMERLSRERSGPWQLPAVVLRSGSAVPGEQAGGEAVQEALVLLNELTLRGGWKLADVAVTADSLSSIAIRYAGREVRIGAGNYEEKLRRLSEVMADVQQRRVQFSYVDLRPERQAAVMMEKQRVQDPGSRGRGARH